MKAITKKERAELERLFVGVPCADDETVQIILDDMRRKTMIENITEERIREIVREEINRGPARECQGMIEENPDDWLIFRPDAGDPKLPIGTPCYCKDEESNTFPVEEEGIDLQFQYVGYRPNKDPQGRKKSEDYERSYIVRGAFVIDFDYIAVRRSDIEDSGKKAVGHLVKAWNDDVTGIVYEGYCGGYTGKQYRVYHRDNGQDYFDHVRVFAKGWED